MRNAKVRGLFSPQTLAFLFSARMTGAVYSHWLAALSAETYPLQSV
jgi:hypothetical protein